jgi:hypothetical protein
MPCWIGLILFISFLRFSLADLASAFVLNPLPPYRFPFVCLQKVLKGEVFSM